MKQIMFTIFDLWLSVVCLIRGVYTMFSAHRYIPYEYLLWIAAFSVFADQAIAELKKD